jgi:signal transduction histidine kinase
MRQRPWVVLVGGFGGLLLLMAAAETGTLYFLGSLRRNSANLEDRFLSRNRELEQIRSNIYLSGTIARDSLLAPEPEGVRAEIAALGSLRRDTQAALEHYAESLDPQEAPPFRALQSQIEAYWKVLNGAFLWTSDQRNKFRYAFFYEELVPRRTSMLQIADRIEALDEQALKRGHEKLDALFGRLQLGLMAIIAVTLLGGAALAASTIFYILRLEGEARRRLEESVQAQASLQELSAKLVRAQEDERRALSRELHDEVGQSFSAILMESENLLDLDANDTVRRRSESIRSLAEKGMNEIRDMALLLRPSMLDDFGLIPALNWQARELAKRTGMRVQVHDEAPEELPDEHKTCVYRVVQEALNNCARHAQATTVQIGVRGETGRLYLSVQDDGSGFDPLRVRGLGLRGMEERVRHLGGKFEIDSQPGRGTLLKIDLPLTTLNGQNGNGNHSHPAG